MRSISARHQVLAVILALVLSAVIVGVIRSHRHLPAGPPAAMLHRQADGAVVVVDDSPLMKQLQVAPVSVDTRPHGLEVPATVRPEPQRRVNILSPVTGRIVEARFRPGDTVHRGEVLALVASGDFDQAYADTQKAQAQLAFEEKVVRRAEGVLAVGGNAQKDLDSARNDYTQAQAELRRAQHRLESLSARAGPAAQGEVPLISPVDGIIASTSLAPGQYISDATATQMVVLDLSEVWIEGAVPEEAIHAVHLGAPAEATLTADPGSPCHAPIFSVDPSLQPDTRRVAARIACANPGLTRLPNMFGTMTIAVPQPPDILVPKSALLMNNDALSVFVQTAPLTYRRRMVTVSYDEGESVRVLSGLQAGERVVVRGGILINDN